MRNQKMLFAKVGCWLLIFFAFLSIHAQDKVCENLVKTLNRKDKIPPAKFIDYQKCVESIEMNLKAIDETDEELGKLSSALNTKKKELENLEKEEKALRDNAPKEQKEGDKAGNVKYDELKEKIPALEKDIQGLEGKIKTAKATLKSSKKIIDLLEKSYDKLYSFYDEQNDMVRASNYETKKENLKKYRN